MCPFCLATMGLIVASAASSGGLAALAVKVSRKKKEAGETGVNAKERRNGNVNECDKESENRNAR
jgi:hypothetical protein